MQKTEIQPFFSIGVTTYDRINLLRICIDSILSQSFRDFEIIIGNDYVGTPITPETLGISDGRIRYLNHERNLGEFDNMNRILDASSGAYFTWLADDDLFSHGYLQKAHDCILKYERPKCLFSSYEMIYGSDAKLSESVERCDGKFTLYDGKTFLRKYLSGEINLISVMGFFERNYLISAGGLQDISEHKSKRGYYGEYMLIINAGLLEKVPYSHAPMIYYRIHQGSWSASNNDVEIRKKAGLNLIRRSIAVLSSEKLQEDFEANLKDIFRLCLDKIGDSCIRSGKLSPFKIFGELYSIRCYDTMKDNGLHGVIRKCYYKAMIISLIHMSVPFFKEIVKKVTPYFMIEIYRNFKKGGRNVVA